MGVRTIQEPEQSDSVALVQQGLVTLALELPDVDGIFGAETSAAVSAFNADRGLSSNDPVVGQETIGRLDTELAFLDGLDDPAFADDHKLLASEPFTAGVLDTIHPDLSITESVLDFFELGDSLCFSMSMAILDAPLVASFVGRFVEPKINKDFCVRVPPCSSATDFFDVVNSAEPYKTFLADHNPAISPDVIDAVGSSVRPDIMTHRPDLTDWYEIKPLSPAGVTAGLVKGNTLKSNYGDNGFPYQPGRRYSPSPEIELGKLITPEGESLEVYIEARRLLSGLIFYRLCIRGDYVRYFNRVRLLAGLLAILAALAPELLAAGAAAEEVAAFVGAIQAAAEAVGVLLPAVVETQ